MDERIVNGDVGGQVRGVVVLMKKNVLGVNNVAASVVDRVGEFLGRKVALQLIGTAAHPDSAAESCRGKLGKKAYLEDWITKITPMTAAATYNVTFEWSKEMGYPGAFTITNFHHSEFYLKTLTLEDVPGHGRVHFICNSWVYHAECYKKDRIFFANQTYLPSQTPPPLRGYREEELENLRGTGTGKLEEWDRVYDYDIYNDLGDPDKGPEQNVPFLGVQLNTHILAEEELAGLWLHQHLRINHMCLITCYFVDPRTEGRIPAYNSLSIYVPRDERFSHLKMSDFVAYALKSLFQFLVPVLKDLFDKTPDEFDSFEDVLRLYDGATEVSNVTMLEKIRQHIPLETIRELLRSDGEKTYNFPLPHVIKEDKDAWRSDEEFGREMLAGINPVIIQCLQAIRNNKLYILDHHDSLMPYLRRINTTAAKTYATRTILFLKEDGTLRPIAIELSLPHPEGDHYGAVSRVCTPAEDGVEGTIWLMAKAYVAVDDSGYHQLISHWLNTHASIEPFIIATNRQLSVLHPIHKLLQPHFRDTMNINALARQALICAGGFVEMTVFPGKYSLEMSSMVYKDWVFPEQALPGDLIKRGVAIKDSSCPHGVRLLIEDYPFAVDGLEIWGAIKTWVQDYCNLYYKSDEMVQEDPELQAWWTEIREKGHGDKKDEPWWPTMQSCEELIESCTTIIWVASALHAALNFGQYPYGGYLPNRPATSRRFIPDIGTPAYEEMKLNPEKAYLKTITPQMQGVLGISLVEILSRHSSDEIYLGQRDSPEWTADTEARKAFERFGDRLRETEQKFIDLNNDKRWRNRSGPVKMPYTLLYPSSEIGLTGRGIPNSISM
nr:LOX4 [Salvia miltiorrhiza]